MVEEKQIKLDYTLDNAEDRKQLVYKILENYNYDVSDSYLQILSDYITTAEYSIKEKTLLTANRMVTVNRREISLEKLEDSFLMGESQIHQLFKPDDKGIKFYQKYEITEEDLNDIPYLKEFHGQIKELEAALASGKIRGKKAYILKKQIIDMRKDQYIIKSAYKPQIPNAKPQPLQLPQSSESKIEILNQKPWVIETKPNTISLFNPHHIAQILKIYSQLKQSYYDNLNSDIHWTLIDLEKLIDKALENQPVLMDILIMRIDGMQISDIVKEINHKYEVNFKETYISSLFIHRIPNFIAETAVDEYMNWYFNQNPNKCKWKRCSKCGQSKPAHPYFFTRNNTSSDNFYSHCKKCRHKPQQVIGIGGK